VTNDRQIIGDNSNPACKKHRNAGPYIDLAAFKDPRFSLLALGSSFVALGTRDFIAEANKVHSKLNQAYTSPSFTSWNLPKISMSHQNSRSTCSQLWMQVAYLDGLRQRTFPTPSDTLTSSPPLHSFLVWQHSSCGWMCGTWLASWSLLLSMDFCRVPLFPCLRPQLPVYRIGARWGLEWACCIVLYLYRESLFLIFRQGCDCDDHCIILFFSMFHSPMFQFLSIIVRWIAYLEISP